MTRVRGWIAERMFKREFRKTLDAVYSMDDFSKQDVAKYVYDKMCLAAFRLKTEGQAAEFSALVAIATFALEARHEAVTLGASSRHDPSWAAAALVESWATSRLGAMRKKFSAALPTKIEGELMALIDDQLSEIEKQAFQEKIW